MRPAHQPQSVVLAHRDFGGSGEPAVLILHGMLGSSRNWQTAGRDLAGHRRVFALDLRNHGLSPHSADMSYESMAADVLAWMDTHGIRRAEVIGHSMGGKVAMLLACRHPERVGHLVVVDIAPKNYQWKAHRDEFQAMNELGLGDLGSRAEAEARMEARVPSWAMRKFLVTNLERAQGGGWKWQVNLPPLTSALPELERNPLVAADRFLGETAFILGGKSNYVGPEDRPVILNHFPRAEIHVIEESGHNPHIEARAALVRLAAAAIGPAGT